MADDIVAHINDATRHIAKLRDSKDLTYTLFGKAGYGYFVDIYSKNPEEVAGVGFNTETKAGARYFANLYSEKLNIPIKSDWDKEE